MMEIPSYIGTRFKLLDLSFEDCYVSTIMHFHTKALDHFQVQDSLCATKVSCEKAAL